MYSIYVCCMVHASLDPHRLVKLHMYMNSEIFLWMDRAIENLSSTNCLVLPLFVIVKYMHVIRMPKSPKVFLYLALTFVLITLWTLYKAKSLTIPKHHRYPQASPAKELISISLGTILLAQNWNISWGIQKECNEGLCFRSGNCEVLLIWKIMTFENYSINHVHGNNLVDSIATLLGCGSHVLSHGISHFCSFAL